jgi:hypothetical protein
VSEILIVDDNSKDLTLMGKLLQAVVNLMKKAQVQRFQENSIPGLVYSVRMEKYKERKARIEQELPVLKSDLKKK